MRWLSGFRSGAFRFALLLALVFGAGAALLLAVVERSISRYAVEATDGGLKSEAAILQGEDREGGRSNLLQAIALHRRAGGEEAFRYQLTDRRGRLLVNDIGTSNAKIGWGEVEVLDDPQDAGARPEMLKSLGVPMPEGGVLVVATDTYDVQELRRGLDRFTLFAGVFITLFVLAGGYLLGGLFMRRLDRVNDAIGRVMAGNVAERLPTIGISREFDLLSSNLNAMLDRIGALMEGLRQVTTDIAHDLRTPLTRLRQQLEATREANSIDHYTAGIDVAVLQTDQILAIFRALLRIGTLEGGDGRQYFRPVNLSEVIGHVVAAHQPVAEDDGKALLAEHEPGLVVAGDAELLAQMLTNLIDNAIRHTPAGSLIVSKLERMDDSVIATISDDGPGVPAGERVNVLSRFYRLDRSRHLPGTGLGMSLAAAIAALHHARIDLLDNTPGLRVRITFPKSPPALEHSASPSKNQAD
ncbi:sensor histidine kinase [Sphingomonas sp. PAMC 26617]|uniref:sensor histidine kinase n=1 Tax=Sphingomonas sp. PAMC 26617 TaxID=1112216 RepID=UPI000287D920|nr:HAMP domain-containing sensor histidine kinase [Sphingomonas sp. PAMC 26617]